MSKRRTLFLACPICDEGTLHIIHTWMDEQDHILKAGKKGLFIHTQTHEWYSLEEAWELYCTRCRYSEKHASKEKLWESIKVMDSILVRQQRQYEAPKKPVNTTSPMKAILRRPLDDNKLRPRIHSFMS